MSAAAAAPPEVAIPALQHTFRYDQGAGRAAVGAPVRLINADFWPTDLVPPGGKPSWCGTCTPALERNRSPLKVAERRAARIVDSVRLAYDATWDWLVDTL